MKRLGELWSGAQWRGSAVVLFDAIFVVLTLSWLHSELTGGARLSLGPITLSNRSADRALLQVLAVTAIHQIVLPGHGLLATAGRWCRQLAGTPASSGSTVTWLDRLNPVAVALLVVVVTRAAVLGVGLWATIVATPSGDAARDASLQRSQSAPLEYLNGRWDAGWYASIAIEGYDWDPSKPRVQQNVAFFPAFPVAVRLALEVTGPLLSAVGAPNTLGREPGVRAENAGCILSVVFLFVALIFIGRLAEVDIGRPLSNRAIVVAAVAPFSVFLSAAYTEALLLLSVVTAFWALRAGRLGWWVVCGMLVGLTKQTGFLLSIPFGIYVVANRSRLIPGGHAHWRYVAGILAPAVGAAVYCSYLWLAFGDPFAWVRAQGAWIASARWLQLSYARSLVEFGTLYPYDAINLLTVAVALPLIWHSRRLEWSYVAFGVLGVLIPLIVGVVPLARMTVPLFPLYLVTAACVTRVASFVALGLILLGLQLMVAWQFYGWRPLY